jgi:hypothetical protein
MSEDLLTAGKAEELRVRAEIARTTLVNAGESAMVDAYDMDGNLQPADEAIILERKIVDNSLKIKRNTQVLRELIRDDTPIDQEWVPGPFQAAPQGKNPFGIVREANLKMRGTEIAQVQKLTMKV